MDKKRFDYQKKDLPALKKELAARALFVLLFVIIFAWQFALLIYKHYQNDTSTIFVIASVFTMISSLLFVGVGFIYIFRYSKIIGEVKRKGHHVASLTLFSTLKSDSFIKLFAIISNIVLILMFSVLICAVTYQVLQLIYYSTMMIYLPLVALLALIAFNGVAHINFEIKVSKIVEVYNSPY